MRHMTVRHILTISVATAALALSGPLFAAGGPGDSTANDATPAQSSHTTGAAEPATRLQPNLPPLHLTQAEQQQIRAAVSGKDTEVEFKLKSTKKLKSFTPAVGTKIPPHMPAHALPAGLTQKLPQLADYQYVKVNGELLIVNPMTKKIVEMFPEQPPA